MSIPITKPWFGEEELRAVQRPLETGWVVQGPYVAEFEQRFAEYTGAAHAAATSSCTTALHIAVVALDLRPGDEVLVPAFTWVSTANVVEYAGGKPIFVDIDLDTFNIDPDAAESALTDRTVGMIPVHMFGLAADMDPLLELARRHSLWVIEDAACSFGGWYRGRHTGTLGDAGCFSFHPRKSITTGEGGMLTTERDDVATAARSLRDHGASRSDHDRHAGSGGFLLSEYHVIGFNYRLTDIQGALGVAQMDRAAAILEGRRRVAARYDETLGGTPGLRTPVTPDGRVHGWQAYICLYAPEEPSFANLDALHDRRNALMGSLEEQGIATRQGTHAPVLLDVYRERYGLRPEQFPRATIADRLTIGLPLYPQMRDAEQELVTARLHAALETPAPA